MTVDDNIHRAAEAENRIREKANDPVLAVRARQWSIYGPILVAAVLTTMGSVGGWVGIRMVSSYDNLSAKVDGLKDAVYEKNWAIQSQVNTIQNQLGTLTQHTNDTTAVLNDRVNAISASTRENRDAIDRLKDLIFGRTIPNANH